jgi:hypothetical protein
VATIEEFRPQLTAALGSGWASAVAVAAPWAVFFLGWLAAGLLTPSGTDNTPIRARGPLNIDHAIDGDAFGGPVAHDSELVEA